MSSELVVVYTAAGQAEANLIKSLLEAEGIPAGIVQEGAGAAFGFTVGLMGQADILVAEENAAQARDILEAMERGELGDVSDAPGEPPSVPPTPRTRR